MIFASDLDRTLIYSSRFIENIKEETEVVETKDGVIISYFLKEMKETLKQINQKALFIPITTRTKEQYDRIDILKSEIKPKYHVTTNGGRIFVDEKEDMEWKSHLNKKLKFSFSLLEVKEKFLRLSKELKIKKVNKAGELFLYAVLEEEKISKDWKKEFSKEMDLGDWKISHQGRKLYMLPNMVNKKDAIKYISDKEDNKFIISSGDSKLDLGMKEISKLFIAPKHGEVIKMIDENSPNVYITKEEGILSTRDILNKIQTYF